MFATVAPLFAESRVMPMLWQYEPLPVDAAQSYFESEDLSLPPLSIDGSSAYYQVDSS